MKQIKALIIIAAILAASVATALADAGTQDFGITNQIVAAGTESSNVGSAINVSKQVDGGLGLVARVQGSSAGTSNITVTLARSPDGTVWETTPRFTWIFPLNGTTEVVAYTNLASGLLGAAHSVKIISVANADDTIVTNAYIKAVLKRN